MSYIGQNEESDGTLFFALLNHFTYPNTVFDYFLDLTSESLVFSV